MADAAATTTARTTAPTTESTGRRERGVDGPDDDLRRHSVVVRHASALKYAAVEWSVDASSTVVLALEGTWCTYSVECVSDQLYRWAGSSGTAAVVDLRRVAFCDGRAISMLLKMQDLAADSGGQLRLSRPSRCVRTLFEICDLSHRLDHDVVTRTPRHDSGLSTPRLG